MKNRAIEFYRFIAIICIAVFHFNIQYTGEFLLPKGGYLGVEFFFILSGFFLMKTFKSENRPKTAQEFWLRRIKRLYPGFILMMVLFLLFDILIRGYITSPAGLVTRIENEMWDLLLLHDIGIPNVFSYEGSIWFLCSLSINLYVIYYMLLRYEDTFTNLLIPVLCIVGYGYIGKQFGTLSMQAEWVGGGTLWCLGTWISRYEPWCTCIPPDNSIKQVAIVYPKHNRGSVHLIQFESLKYWVLRRRFQSASAVSYPDCQRDDWKKSLEPSVGQ